MLDHPVMVSESRAADVPLAVMLRPPAVELAFLCSNYVYACIYMHVHALYASSDMQWVAVTRLYSKCGCLKNTCRK